VWYLKRNAELAKRVDLGYGEDTPEQVNTPGVRALYNNLKETAFSTMRSAYMASAAFRMR
jgi:type I restriction enzyme R subunit